MDPGEVAHVSHMFQHFVHATVQHREAHGEEIVHANRKLRGIRPHVRVARLRSKRGCVLKVLCLRLIAHYSEFTIN